MSRPRIKTTFQFARVHEVVGFGRARPPTSARSSQIEVEVILAPVDPPDWRFDATFPAVSLWIGCGELPAVPIGSRWRNGECCGQRRSRDVLQAEGMVARVTKMSQGDWGGGRGASFFPTRLTADSRCFQLELDHSGIGIVLVPLTEMLRAVFGRTSDLLLQLYGGRADELSAPSRFQVDDDRWSLEDGVFHLRCRTRPSREQAMLAAMILSDGRLREAFYGVNGNLVQSMLWKREKPTVVATACPLAPGARISFEGRWLARAAAGRVERRFLVTRLLSVSIMPAFNKLVATFPTSLIDKDAPPRDSRIIYGPVDTIVLRAERDPGPGRRSTEVEVPGAEVMPGSDVEFVALSDEPVSIAPPPSFAGEDTEDEAFGSAGDKVPGGDSKTRHVRYKIGDVPDGPDARESSMAKTGAVLASLSRAEGWPIVYRRRVGLYEDVGGIKVLLVGLSVEGVEIMICDGGPSSGGPRSLGFVRRVTKGVFDAGHMTRLRRFIVVNDARWIGKRNAAAELGFVAEGVQRGSILLEEDTRGYSALIKATIKKLVI